MPDNKIKVYELAKTLGVKSVFLMDKMRKEWNLPVKSHMEVLSPDLVKKIEKKFSTEKENKATQSKKKKTVRKVSTGKTVKKVVAKKTKSYLATKDPSVGTIKKSVKKTEEDVKKPKTMKSRVIRRRKEDQKEISPVNLEKISSDQDLLSKQTGPVSKEIRSSAKNIISDLVSVKKSDSLKDIFLDVGKESVSEKEDHKKQSKKPLVEKEVISKFNSTDFRKREVIFQPKKKRILATGNFKSTKITTPKSHKRILKVHGEMKVETICKKIGIKRSALIKKLKSEGIDTKGLEVLDFETISLIVSDFGFEVKNVLKTEQDLLESDKTSKAKTEEFPKPPIVTIMGHVDHGKTTLLDAIRKTKVVEGEAGGITQHIGAYSVPFNKTFITFIDTPGHEAFTAMRARGAKVTDIVIIVVSATDGVMLQTVEAINHAKAAKIPIIVGMTKMDAQGANPDKIKQQMSEHEIVPEDWGGDTSFMPLAALKGEGLKELLEQIHLMAEIQELKCHPKDLARGTVLEARVEKGRGCVVNLLVQDGTLHSGENVIAGQYAGRVRQMKSDQGRIIKEAGSGTPIEVIGFSELPQAGDSFNVIKDEKAAKELMALRKQQQQSESVTVPLTVEELLTKTYSSDNKKELNLILKADVRGSLEALKSGLEKLTSDNVSVKTVHTAIGSITESDILLASTVGGVILGFSVRPDGKASKMARDKSVDIYTYSVIYELLDHVKKMMLGLLEPEYVEEDLGKAEVRNIFHISKLGTVAGCYVTSGQIVRNGFIRLVRDGRLVHDGRILSLKRFKDDAKEVSSGLECGIVIENFNDIKPKDILESYIKKEVSRTEL